MQAVRIHSPTQQRKEKDSGTSKQEPLLRLQPKETTLGRKSMQHISNNSELKTTFSYWRKLQSAKCYGKANLKNN